MWDGVCIELWCKGDLGSTGGLEGGGGVGGVMVTPPWSLWIKSLLSRRGCPWTHLSPICSFCTRFSVWWERWDVKPKSSMTQTRDASKAWLNYSVGRSRSNVMLLIIVLPTWVRTRTVVLPGESKLTTTVYANIWCGQAEPVKAFFWDVTSNAVEEFYKHAHDSTAIELFSMSQHCDGLQSDITNHEHL